jgi:hypothetical protein
MKNRPLAPAVSTRIATILIVFCSQSIAQGVAPAALRGASGFLQGMGDPLATVNLVRKNAGQSHSLHRMANHAT